MPLDPVKEIEELRQMYKEDPRQETFNILLLGEYGTGKTYIGRTARKPVHIDSWDPGGTKGLREWIEKGDIVVDTRYESEDPSDPSQYVLWYKTFNERLEAGYFKRFATYMLDGGTQWTDAILSAYLKKKGGFSAIPTYKDHYHYQKLDLKTYIKKMLDLPCDFILTGHLELKQEGEGSGPMKYVYATTGKGAYIIPSLFDEVYVALTKETSTGVKYQLLTENIGRYSARSRLKAGGKLDTYEEPDIKKLLSKAGLSTADKEPV